MKRERVAIIISLVVALLMLGGKWVAFLLTDSAAIFSDAAESLVHIAATAIAAFSVWYASQPADREHPYGHGKFAYFSAGFEGGLILCAALAILYTAIVELIRGPELHRLELGVAITAGLGLINLFLGLYLVRVGRATKSTTLVANGRHVLTDMWTSLGVVGGVGLVWITGIAWLDPVVAIFCGLQILFSASGLLREAYHGLMDRVDPAVSARIIGVCEDAVRDELVREFHQLRVRETDGQLFVESHVVLAGSMTLTEAHDRVSEFEERIRAALPDLDVLVTTHPEPAHEAAHDHRVAGVEETG